MGRRQIEERQPASWSMWNILNYQYWQHKLKSKKHTTRRLAMCWRNLKTVPFNYDDDEMQQLWDADKAGYFEVKPRSSPTNKSSSKERMKSIIAKETCKNENRNHTTLGSPARQPESRRTDSLHHLQPSDHCLSDSETSWTHPIIILRRSSSTRLETPSSAASSYTPKEMDTRQLGNSRERLLANECGVDVFEIYGVNKDLFLKALKENKRKSKFFSEQSKTVAATNQDDVSAIGSSQRIRRTDFLKESLDRYARLFEQSFNKETKLDPCKSLRLGSEDKILSKRASRFCRSISSFSDIESICSLLTEVSCDTFSSEMPIGTLEDYNASTGRNSCSEQKIVSIPEETVKFEALEAVIVNEEQKLTVEERSSPEVVQESFPQIDEEIDSAMNPCRETAEQDLVFDVEDCFEDNTTNSVKLQVSKDEQECSVILLANSNKTGDAKFNIVRDVLDLSGFISNEFPEAWHSIEQPLNPSLLKEMETFFYPDDNCHQQQLLFDLNNEALLNIYDRSYTYFPKAFSISPCPRPLPRGSCVVDEVWLKVSWYLDFKPRLDQSLDDIIAQDMAKGDVG